MQTRKFFKTGAGNQLVAASSRGDAIRFLRSEGWTPPMFRDLQEYHGPFEATCDGEDSFEISEDQALQWWGSETGFVPERD